MSAEDDMIRAERARLLLAEPLLIEAFETISQELTQAWQNSPARDVDGRETLWLSLKLLTQVQQHLISVMESGKMAQVELARRGPRLVNG